MGDRGRGFRGGHGGGRGGRPQEQQQVRRPGEAAAAHEYNRPASVSYN